jgi:poly(ADP-ribose) glycohydrolase ARH3
MDNKSLLRKYQGCIIGQCLGDAIGYPIEGLPPDECCNFIYNKVKVWFDGSIPEIEWTGQYTDDSQLARELLESLVENKKFDPIDYANRIALIFKEDRIVGRGMATDQAARRINQGTPWNKSGCLPPSAGNGTAMRAAPIGLFYYNDIPRLIETAHEQGFITHQDPRCSAGSIAIAGAVALALKSEKINTEVFIVTLSKMMIDYSKEFADLVNMLSDWIKLEPDKAVEEIAPAGKLKEYIDGWPGISPFVIPSVLWSLYSFLRYPESYWDAISTSVSIGGDVDTTGAMTGAISGAYLGIDVLPQHITKLLNDNGEWTYQDLIILAEECYNIVCEK